MKQKKVSIIVPCYNEEASLPYFKTAIDGVAAGLPAYQFEYIFVDDGSSDRTLAVLRTLAQEDERVRFLSFSRNFGKEAAMFAGLEAATGDFVGIMDADLQDPPSLLPEMIATLEAGDYDCVATRRVNRKGEPPIRSFFARRFYRLMHKISKTEIVDGARDFRLMKRRMVKSILSLKEYNRFSKGIFGWVGYKTKWLEYENVERAHGETKWSFWKLLFYSVDGIVAFSTVPLAISSILGIVFCILAFLALVFVFVRQLIWQNSAYGWASAICIFFLISGIQLFTIGILGQYLAKTYLEVKKRPLYIVSETDQDAAADEDAADRPEAVPSP